MVEFRVVGYVDELFNNVYSVLDEADRLDEFCWFGQDTLTFALHTSLSDGPSYIYYDADGFRPLDSITHESSLKFDHDQPGETVIFRLPITIKLLDECIKSWDRSGYNAVPITVMATQHDHKPQTFLLYGISYTCGCGEHKFKISITECTDPLLLPRLTHNTIVEIDYGPADEEYVDLPRQLCDIMQLFWKNKKRFFQIQDCRGAARAILKDNDPNLAIDYYIRYGKHPVLIRYEDQKDMQEKIPFADQYETVYLPNDDCKDPRRGVVLAILWDTLRKEYCQIQFQDLSEVWKYTSADGSGGASLCSNVPDICTLAISRLPLAGCIPHAVWNHHITLAHPAILPPSVLHIIISFL
jgi:hypothetical protein